MMNPYETMWKVLLERIEDGKTGWGKQEMLAQMREIEVGALRVYYQANCLLQSFQSMSIPELEAAQAEVVRQLGKEQPSG